MQTHQIHVLGARERVHNIRHDLFAFPEVLEVFVTGRPNVLVVVHAGRPRPGEWLRVLRALGYRTPARGSRQMAAIERRSGLLLCGVGSSEDPRVDDGDRATSSIPDEQARRRGRDAA